jgi:hypothetical protein
MLILFVSILCSCTSISEFSPEAYKQAVDLKVESLELMSFATESYLNYREDVDLLKQEMRKLTSLQKEDRTMKYQLSNGKY